MSRIMMKSKKYCFHLLMKCLTKKMQKHYIMMKISMNGNANSYFDDSITDTETFSYGHYDGPKQIMVQAVYLGNYSQLCADIKGEGYSMIDYDPDGSLEGIYDNTYKIPMFVDNGTTVNLMPRPFMNKLHFCIICPNTMPQENNPHRQWNN